MPDFDPTDVLKQIRPAAADLGTRVEAEGAAVKIAAPATSRTA